MVTPQMASRPTARQATLLVAEFPLILGIALTLLFWLVFPNWFVAPEASPVRSSILFGGLFLSILWCAFSVVRHADCLAILLGEPLGTIILTLAVIGIEVTMIATVMLTGEANPELGRDTMFAVLMLVMNGLVGITLLVGGLRHHEQVFNFRGANAYLSVIIPLAVLGLILPRYSAATSDASASLLLSIFLIAMCVVLYVVFLGVQTLRHRKHFTQPDAEDEDHAHDVPGVLRSVPFHAVLLVATMVPVVLLSKKLAVLMDVGVETLNAPPAIAGVVVAVLVLTPEGVAAIRSAMHNQLQRGINICLGSALATIGLTIPAVILVGMITGLGVQLGLPRQEELLLMMTLLLSTVTFASGRTGILQGTVHLVVCLAWLTLIFD